MATAARLLLSAAALGAGGVGAAVMTDEAAGRNAYFFSRALPVLAHYRAVEYMNKHRSDAAQLAALEPLHERYAPFAVETITALKGFFIKIGQMGATRSDFVADQYIRRLKTLQDAVPRAWGAAETRALVAAGLGVPGLESVFSSFDDVPVGSASIGQVHRATLRATGQVVAVKVQDPAAERLFRSDIAAVRLFCTLAAPEHVPMFDEIRVSFMTEFDYSREARALETVRANLRRSPFCRDVVVPRPIPGLCTKTVLVMEFLPGVKLVDGIRGSFSALAARRGVSASQLESEARARDAGITDSSPWMPGPWALAAARVAMRVCDVANNAPRWLWNATVVAAGIGRRREPVWSPLPLDTRRILDLLLRVHAHEVFVDGLFNSDPHPGNVLLLPDGRLGLIDYGQARALSRSDRVAAAKIVVALADGDESAVLESMRSAGFSWRRNLPEVVAGTATVLFDRCDRGATAGMTIQAYMEHLNGLDAATAVPGPLVMVGRASVMLRGLGINLGHEMRAAALWMPAAEACLWREDPAFMRARQVAKAKAKARARGGGGDREGALALRAV